MHERSPAANDLDARLAEIDDALREIQAALVPEGVGVEDKGPVPPADEPGPERAESEPALDEREQAPEDEPEAPARRPRERPRTSARGRRGPLEEVLQRTARGRRGRGVPIEVVAQLTEAHLQLLASSRRLLDAYLDVIDALGERGAEASAHELTLDAGPFATLGAVRAFEAALATLPGVVQVSVRGYERSDRAIIDVQLGTLGS